VASPPPPRPPAPPPPGGGGAPRKTKRKKEPSPPAPPPPLRHHHQLRRHHIPAIPRRRLRWSTSDRCTSASGVTLSVRPRSLTVGITAPGALLDNFVRSARRRGHRYHQERGLWHSLCNNEAGSVIKFRATILSRSAIWFAGHHRHGAITNDCQHHLRRSSSAGSRRLSRRRAPVP